MRNLLILAVAASFAVACHSRTEDEVGAAPDRGDTTAVVADTMAAPTDTTMGQMPPADTSFAQPDTSAVTDTSYTPSETGTPTDTLSTEGADTSAGAWSDTTAADTTAADTTQQQ